MLASKSGWSEDISLDRWLHPVVSTPTLFSDCSGFGPKSVKPGGIVSSNKRSNSGLLRKLIPLLNSILNEFKLGMWEIISLNCHEFSKDFRSWHRRRKSRCSVRVLLFIRRFYAPAWISISRWRRALGDVLGDQDVNPKALSEHKLTATLVRN